MVRKPLYVIRVSTNGACRHRSAAGNRLELVRRLYRQTTSFSISHSITLTFSVRRSIVSKSGWTTSPLPSLARVSRIFWRPRLLCRLAFVSSIPRETNNPWIWFLHRHPSSYQGASHFQKPPELLAALRTQSRLWQHVLGKKLGDGCRVMLVGLLHRLVDHLEFHRVDDDDGIAFLFHSVLEVPGVPRRFNADSNIMTAPLPRSKAFVKRLCTLLRWLDTAHLLLTSLPRCAYTVNCVLCRSIPISIRIPLSSIRSRVGSAIKIHSPIRPRGPLNDAAKALHSPNTGLFDH